MNPKAWEKEPLTVEQVMNARMVSYPFTVRDCCLVLDGGRRDCDGARGPRQIAEKETGVCVGTGESLSHANISSMPDFTVSAAKESGEQAYAMAKMKPSDMQMLVAV